jgi:hypothetical protein
MKRSRWVLRCAAAATVGLTIAATSSAGLAAASPAGQPADQGAVSGPIIKLIAAQRSITVQQYGPQLFVDPGIYVVSYGAPLVFDVQRVSYAKPLTIVQIIHVAGWAPIRRPLPAWVLDGWNGLHRFMRVTVTNSAGKIVDSRVLPFCPNMYNPQRAVPNSPATSPYPQQCSSDPFEKGMVLGLQRGWGVDATQFGLGNRHPLKLGRYTVTASITRIWRRLLHVTPRAATARVRLILVKGSGCGGPFCPPPPPNRPVRVARALPMLPAVPYLSSPPRSVLPDLVPTPSWGISIQHIPGTKTRPANDQLEFGATVWIGGHGPLDVEGFRVRGSMTMDAYQYFWRNGHVIGRIRVGTMGFAGYNNWHFKQFAQYRLLTSTKKVVVRSHKEGFCIAPTDAIDLALRHATWQPSYLGLNGACGSESALSVQEILPLGWGDTYFQDVPGESFNITHLPNGTYYIEVIVNPEGLLHESNTANDTSLRKVILGGTPGHRTVRVPAYHGIDPER